MLPSSLTRDEILSSFPEIKIHMINKATSLVHAKGIYSKPGAYLDHSIDENTEKVAMEFYINHDFNIVQDRVRISVKL